VGWADIPEGIDSAENAPKPEYSLREYEGSEARPDLDKAEFLIEVHPKRWFRRWCKVVIWSRQTGWRTLGKFPSMTLAVTFAQNIAEDIYDAKRNET
jgi:hypothetical protein